MSNTSSGPQGVREAGLITLAAGDLQVLVHFRPGDSPLKKDPSEERSRIRVLK